MNDFEIVNRIEIARAWEQDAKRQQRKNFWKWIMLVAVVIIVIVVALVWAGQLSAGQRVYAVASQVDAGRVKVTCTNDGDATVEPSETFGQLVVSCGTWEADTK